MLEHPISEQGRGAQEAGLGCAKKRPRGGREGVPAYAALVGCQVLSVLTKAVMLNPPFKSGRGVLFVPTVLPKGHQGSRPHVGACTVRADYDTTTCFAEVLPLVQAVWPRHEIISYVKFICSLVHWWQISF